MTPSRVMNVAMVRCPFVRSFVGRLMFTSYDLPDNEAHRYLHGLVMSDVRSTGHSSLIALRYRVLERRANGEGCRPAGESSRAGHERPHTRRSCRPRRGSSRRTAGPASCGPGRGPNGVARSFRCSFELPGDVDLVVGLEDASQFHPGIRERVPQCLGGRMMLALFIAPAG